MLSGFMRSKKIEKIDLANFDEASSKQWAQFMAQTSQQKCNLKDQTIKWFDSKEKKNSCILCFPDTTGKPETWFLYYMDMKSKLRVLLPEFPEVDTVELFCECIHEWLLELNVDDVTIMGQSFGGALAQAYADKYPSDIKSLVLIDSFSNTNEVSKKTRNRQIKDIKHYLSGLQNLKFESFIKTMYKQIQKGIDVAFVEDKPFWKAFYGNLVQESTPELLERIYKMQLDYWTCLNNSRPSWLGKVILLESETALEYGREEKKALHNRYPSATIVKIDGSANMFHIRARQKIIKKIFKGLAQSE